MLVDKKNRQMNKLIKRLVLRNKTEMQAACFVCSIVEIDRLGQN